MKTLNSIRPLILATGLLATCVGQAQVTWLGNNSSSGDYVGCDNTSPFPLEMRQNDNQPIEFFTDNVFRMRLNEDLPTQSINGISPLNLSSFLGVGNFTGTYTRAAARFHANNAAGIDDGYRAVMGEGFLATRGETLCYTGVLGAVNSGTLWSQITGSTGTPGSFRFIYTGGNGGTIEQAETTAGLEMARFVPTTSLNEGYFGLGDWHQPRLMRCSELTRGELINRQHRTA